MQRYETPGDYYDEPRGGKFPKKCYTEKIVISELEDKNMEFLIAIHELIEKRLTEHRGISEKSITEFDVEFEKNKLLFEHDMDDSPGDDPSAPYHLEHRFAERIERLVASELDVDWEEYGKRVENLSIAKNST